MKPRLPKTLSVPLPSLKIAVDGAARGNPGPAAIGVVLNDAQGRPVKKLGLYLGAATNNVAEYLALIVGLQEALKLSARQVQVATDSQLLSRQISGDYRVKDEVLHWLKVVVENLIQGFEKFEIRHLPRAQNRLADALANQAIREAIRRGVVPKRKNPPPAKLTGHGQATFWT